MSREETDNCQMPGEPNKDIDSLAHAGPTLGILSWPILHVGEACSCMVLEF
jgi:hypothetical protein